LASTWCSRSGSASTVRPWLDHGHHALRAPARARHLVDEGRHLHPLAVQRHLAGLQPGQVQQRADQPRQPPGLRQRRLQRLGVGPGDAVGEVLQQRLQGGEGRAQLVADVGHQAAALLVDAREVGGHRVEGAGQLADLVAGGRRHPHVVVAAGHPAGGRRHLAQRRRRAARQQLHGRQRDDEAERHRHPCAQPGLDAQAQRDDGDRRPSRPRPARA
jgi:hypothetical protein